MNQRVSLINNPANNGDLKFRVSSVLNKDVKQFGKQYIFDNLDDTCWNSDQGTPQWIWIEFPSIVCVEEVVIQFQGGFAGKDSWLETTVSRDIPMAKHEDIYPEDINAVQRFIVSNQKPLKYLKIVFSGSTDFFGRIIVYKLDIIGKNVQT